MEIKDAKYLTSSVTLDQCPPPEMPEYALIGRSNVGKSSLINLLTGRKKLALISGQPGKTQTINHFLINDSWYLVDLPGYGYAKVSKTSRAKWEKMIRNYLLLRENLGCVFVLIDGSIPPQQADMDFIRWLGESGVAMAIVFTKTDRGRQHEVAKNVAAFQQKMQEEWEQLPPMFQSSAAKGRGKEKILDFMEGVNRQFKGE